MRRSKSTMSRLGKSCWDCDRPILAGEQLAEMPIGACVEGGDFSPPESPQSIPTGRRTVL
jgi:hypothetical protein